MEIENQEMCPECGERIIFVETKMLTHYGKLQCEGCGKWIKWVKNPESVRTRTQTSKRDIKDVLRFHKKENEICFFCLRTREQLGECETMTLDHIEELDKDGKDELENMQVLCTACHKLKNWARLYMNWHLNQK